MTFLSLLSSSLFSLFVALCSANFLLSKSLVTGGDFDENIGLFEVPLVNDEVVFDLLVFDFRGPLLFMNLLGLFSITTEFFPCVFAIAIFFIVFLAEPDIVNFVFFFFFFYLIFIIHPKCLWPHCVISM